MLCPACGEDYSESYAKIEGSKRKVLGPLDHLMLPYMLKGYYCPNCGKVMEFITYPTGNLFHKRLEIKDEKLLYTTSDFWNYLTEKNLLEDFRNFAGNKKKIAKQQQELFE